MLEDDVFDMELMRMCLSKPHQVIKFDGKHALVQFQDIKKLVASTIKLKSGDFVICQGNFVVQKIPPKKAREMFEEWEKLNTWI